MHTPGPWNFFHRKESNMTIAEVYRKTGERLCGVELTETIVRFPYFRTKAEHDQALANARLIAAAPDLLKALTAWLGSTSEDEQTGSMAAVYRFAVLTVKQATQPT